MCNSEYQLGTTIKCVQYDLNNRIFILSDAETNWQRWMYINVYCQPHFVSWTVFQPCYRLGSKKRGFVQYNNTRLRTEGKDVLSGPFVGRILTLILPKLNYHICSIRCAVDNVVRTAYTIDICPRATVEPLPWKQVTIYRLEWVYKDTSYESLYSRRVEEAHVQVSHVL